MNDGRISRVTFPTASFSLTTDLIEWIAKQAASLGVTKSQFVRSLMEQEMIANDEEREALSLKDGNAA